MTDPTNVFAMDDIKFMTGYNVEPVVASETAVIEAIQKYYPTGGAPSPSAGKAAGSGAADGAAARARSRWPAKGLEELQALARRRRRRRGPRGAAGDQRRGAGQAGRRSAGRPAGERRADVGDSEGRERHPHRAVREGAARPLPHRRHPLQHHGAADEVPRRDRRRASRSWRSSTSPRSACRRTAASRSASTRTAQPKEIDFRVSVLPTLFGEKIVMRLLDKDKLMLDMTKLGFEPESLAKFETAILRPWGMVLVTGPTGSGKTNTLYSSISKINTPETNIMTAEDPVEFNLAGVNQVQVKENIGLNFAAALRSFLRQDPNIILVGEIRDFETAEIAVKAALTGHLVLSTLHTNDAPSTINRLMNMGIEPFLVASSVHLICAQRLVPPRLRQLQGAAPDAAGQRSSRPGSRRGSRDASRR